MATNENTQGQSKKNALNWKEVSIGGISGILLGGASTFAATASTRQNIDEAEEETEMSAEETQTQEEATTVAYGNVASGVNDSMTFNEAFATARNEVGAGGCFVWHGNVYGTYYANEWNAMSPEQREEFAHHATTGVDITHSSQTYAHNSASGNSQQTTIHQTEQIHQEETNEEDLTVEVLGVEQVQNEDGSVSNIGAASINGQAVYFIDVDGQNGEFDLMASDLNSNGQLEENEVTDISEQHMSVSHFQELAQASGNGTGSGDEVEEYYASNDNLPDYVNDADPADLA